MSAPAPALPPAAVQQTLINTGLNSAMLLTFLMGMYTLVYFGTMYLYGKLTKNASQRAIVVSATTCLYLLNVAQLAIQWQLLKSSIVDNGETRETIFITTFLNPGWATLSSEICTFLSNILADGLLIWRCFHVWNRSFRAISLPLFLLLAESGLYLTVIIFASITKLMPSPSQATALDDILSVGYFISFASTVSTTILIAYRIYSVSRQDPPSKKRFLHILDILVQSAAAYSLTLLVAAVAAVLTTKEAIFSTQVFGLLNYDASALLFFISGVAPTIMVARVSLAAENTSDGSASTRVSGLQFRNQSTVIHDTQTAMEGMLVINGSTNSPLENEKNIGAI